MERKDIPENLKWDLSDFFVSDEAWEKEFKQIEKEYGNSNTDNPDENKIHEETLYIKAYDMYGNLIEINGKITVSNSPIYIVY